ncbi:hypothetical protein D1164_04920 [Mariniphaga sediminis]|jgi:hypothetical protein|uniref:WxL domain-containing protein n=1 Tax=Mariniphaga sediminis TaxID=1628158 RepID=A0A399D458_9BACT|nr:hypothetical protein [Mariniphaga sediminis]RIH66256.1 hypothetical protein D1164_04920 [Mariniphaga sediminis]
MKKLAFILTSIILISATVKVSTGSTGDDETSSHNLGISVPEVALVDVEGPSGEGTTINLSPNINNLEAGAAVDFTTANDNSLWLNYTSIIEQGNNGNGNGNGSSKTRKIKAEIDENLPDGLDLMLEVGTIASGSGQTGTAIQEKIALKKGPTTVIDDIGSCYTENGAGKGHRLTYSLAVKDNKFDKVMAETFSVQVTYTITEN